MILRHAAPALLGLSMAATSAQALDLNAMNDAEKAEFGAQVREYLLENPEVIIEAINILEERNAVAEAAADKELVAANVARLELPFPVDPQHLPRLLRDLDGISLQGPGKTARGNGLE